MRFRLEFLRRVLEEAGGPTHVLGLETRGEREIFILHLDRNGHWYHLTHQGRYIHFPQQQFAQDFIAAMTSQVFHKRGEEHAGKE
jgi:hypothetical protein